MAKHFVMGDASVTETEPKSTPTKEELQAVTKGDGYDALRIKALESSEYASQREAALKDVERTILDLKARKAKPVPKTSLRPFEDRVLIMPDKPRTMTEAGLYLPESAVEKELPETGVVVAAGPGKYINGILNPVTVEPGDRVYYGKYAGTEIEDKKIGEKFLCMRFADVFCKE